MRDVPAESSSSTAVPGNPDQARTNAATRAKLLAALENKLRSDGPKSVVANKGYNHNLKAEKDAFVADFDKARDEQRFDGMWVLCTNTEMSAVELALRYKQLWIVEQVFRTAKSLLDTRPIFHKTDATICGHVFCSFLALVLRDELFRRMDNAGVSAESVGGQATTSYWASFTRQESHRIQMAGVRREFCGRPSFVIPNTWIPTMQHKNPECAHLTGLRRFMQRGPAP